MFARSVAAWTIVLSCCGIAWADEFPLAKGFSNYYFNEPAGVDWATNCRVVGNVQSGTSLPVRLALSFKFQWNTANGIGNNQSTFREYVRSSSTGGGTLFDLVIDRGQGFEYTQANAVRPSLTGTSGAERSTATVQFADVILNVATGGESRIPFEIYGDCDRCQRNQEANPSQFTKRTTWRIFGTIRVTADSNGNLTDWAIEGVDSQTPEKQLNNQGGQHLADWYPKRQLARRTTFTDSPTSGTSVACELQTRCHTACCLRVSGYNTCRRVWTPRRYRR